MSEQNEAHESGAPAPESPAPQPTPSHIDLSESGVRAITVSPSSALGPTDLMSFVGGAPVAPAATEPVSQSTSPPAATPAPTDPPGE